LEVLAALKLDVFIFRPFGSFGSAAVVTDRIRAIFTDRGFASVLGGCAPVVAGRSAFVGTDRTAAAALAALATLLATLAAPALTKVPAAPLISGLGVSFLSFRLLGGAPVLTDRIPAIFTDRGFASGLGGCAPIVAGRSGFVGTDRTAAAALATLLAALATPPAFA